MRSEVQRERHELELVEWRLGRLVQSGFSPRLASQVATDERFDLHALIELVERGCPPQLAVRILWPLEDRESRA
jgi:hypothetical protein